jgi:hypothetical protein
MIVVDTLMKAGPILLSTLVLGCLATDPAKSQSDTGILEDDFAGATSSTNWPPPFAPGEELAWTCDTLLKFVYLNAGELIPSEGTATLFKAHAIPFPGQPSPVSAALAKGDTLFITRSIVESLGNSQDTVNFNVLLELNGAGGSARRVMAFGLGYSRKNRQFFNTGDSIKPVGTADVSVSPDSIKGTFLNPDSLPPAPGGGIPQCYYYIPGTPFFGKITLRDTMRIGPVVKGTLPLRLLRVTPVNTGSAEAEAEIFEIEEVKHVAPGEYRIGRMLLPAPRRIEWKGGAAVSL